MLDRANRTVERWVAGHEEHRQIVITLAQRVREPEAVELRHVDVGEHAVEILLRAFERANGGPAMLGEHDRPTFAAEHACAQSTDGVVIVDHEDPTEMRCMRSPPITYSCSRDGYDSAPACLDARTISSAARSFSSFHGFKK